MHSALTLGLLLYLYLYFVLHVYFDVDVCTILCARLGNTNAYPSWLSFYFRFSRSRPYISLISKRSGPVHVGQRLSCRSGLTGAPGGMSRSVGQICLRTDTKLGTASLVFDADPCQCIGRWVPGLMVEFAGARHHPAYWLGTSLHCGQERAPEYVVVPYATI